MTADEGMGGDPACWSHLFEAEDASAVIDLAGMAELAPGRGPLWSQQTDDLNVNLLRFPRGEGIGEHINTEVDVLLVGVSGSGLVAIDGVELTLAPGRAVIVPRGAVRAITATDELFSYLTCHRRRAGLMPTTRGTSTP